MKIKKITFANLAEKHSRRHNLLQIQAILIFCEQAHVSFKETPTCCTMPFLILKRLHALAEIKKDPKMPQELLRKQA
ncbi:MAG: hypothetical protein AAB241_03790, partial [Pseudomonadota bacterium]